MKIPPSYTITPEILELIAKIDATRNYLSMLNIPLEVKNNLQRVSILKSALYSARIEGNPLTLEEVEFTSDKLKKLEVFNISDAVTWLNINIKKDDTIAVSNVLDIHRQVLKNIDRSAGKIRNELSAIFNQAGVAVYMPPPPSEINDLLDKLLQFIKSDQEKFPIITAMIAHLIFEKIHPFIDGNGRVGRLLILAVLKVKNYYLPLHVPFEQFIDDNKNDYYYYLDIGLKNPTEYLLFMLNAFYKNIEIMKSLAENKLSQKEIPFLPPRQEEIFNIIKEHTMVSFDFLSRRFLKIPKRTLRYDLKKLQDKKLIVKIGETKGSYYKVRQL